MQFVAVAADAQILVNPITGTTLSTEGRLENLAINGAIGSLTGLAWAAIRHSHRSKGALQGAAGGLLMSVGRQMAASAFNGSGFIGREISAAGVSLTTTAGEKTTLSFPIGPLSVECAEDSYDWRVNISDLIAIVGLSFSPNTRIDVAKSFSSGAAVFKDRRRNFGQLADIELTAITSFGTIQLSSRAVDPVTGKVNVIYHENVHILQDDYFEDAIALPAERALIQHLPFGHRFLRHLDLGLLGPTLEEGMMVIPYKSRPWEREAYALTANLKY